MSHRILSASWSSFRSWTKTQRSAYFTLPAAKAVLIWILKLLPWLIIAAAAYYYIWLGYMNQVHLRNGLDLGTYRQIIYNLSEGRIPPFNTLKGEIAWADHAHFILLLFAPFYYLFPATLTLLAIQAIAITTSAWPIYRIAQDKLKNYFFSFALLLAYLIFFGVQYALDVDFHANVLTAAAVAWSLYALHFKKWPLYWITLGLGLLTREDAATFYVAIGLYLLLTQWKTRKTVAFLTIILSVSYFFIVTYALMPSWAEGNRPPLAYFDVETPSRDPVDIGRWIVTNPITIWQNMTDSSIKVRTMEYLFRSFGYLPLLSPFTYLAVAPNFLARFLSGENQRHELGFHYNVSLVSVLSYGAILTTAWVGRVAERLTHWKHSRLAISSLAAVAILSGAYITSWKDKDLPLHKLYNPRFIDEFYIPRVARPVLITIDHIIGHKASVSAASGLVPTLSEREEIYNFPEPIPRKKVDFVVISNQFNTWPLTKGEMTLAIEEFKANPEYQMIWSEYDIYVFQKRAGVK